MPPPPCSIGLRMTPKILKNTPNLNKFLDAATIKERPLLARIQYVNLLMFNDINVIFPNKGTFIPQIVSNSTIGHLRPNDRPRYEVK